MRWRGRRGSRNVEDRRGRSGGVRRGGAGGAILGGVLRGRRGGRRRAGGIGGLGLVAVLLVGWFLGVDVSPFLGGGTTTDLQSPGPQTRPITPAEAAQGEFASVVLADTEAVWTDVFREQLDARYEPVTLVLFSGRTGSPCGGASGATGPFYCPADEKAYLDTAFFTTLEQRLGAEGDFAAAYVVAHEVAHHVQNELGILGEANRLRRQVGTREANAISVRIELQADCYSGLWARRAQERFDILDPGDVGEAIDAARRIGDDYLQRRAGRVPAPHTFTHGTSEQRARWFRTGWEAGDLAACDTFGAERL